MKRRTKNMGTRIAHLALVVAMLLASGVPVSVAAAEADENVASDLKEIYEEYKDDEQYRLMREAYGVEYAQQFLEDVLDSRIESGINPLGGGGNECYQYVTNIKQTKNYNCGSTTVLQTLYGLDSQSKVSGSKNSERIAALDNEYNVHVQGDMYVYQVADALNKYNVHSSRYTYVAGSGISESAFESYVATSLTNCKPVVLHARTKYFDYYGGHASGRYLSLDYINRTTDKVRIVDCNNNSSYYGVHTVSLSEAYKSIHSESGRYLIY